MTARLAAAEDLRAWQPAKEFFVGIDSDGTVFDSMTIKHVDAFIPAALEVWDIRNRRAFSQYWEEVNLYSKTRGINRFASLLMVFEGFPVLAPAAAPLRAFVDSGEALSAATLETWAASHPHPFFDQVLAWSRSSDALFEAGTENLPAFPAAIGAVKKLSATTDVMVVSSAAGAALVKDWSRTGLAKHCALMAGQEAGNKKTQLALAASGKYAPDKTLMIGDAPGDLEAAQGIGACFYPVIPGQENQSWQCFEQESLGRFLAGDYRGSYEEALVQDFFKRLGME
jgi:phosphoglycolate phosphatase-like HAD superfamily hydrolase